MDVRKVQAADEARIEELLSSEGWTPAQVEGQLDGIKALSASKDGFVAVMGGKASLVGYVSAQFYRWNRLTQIHGLAVVSESRRQGIASQLVGEAEQFARSKAARGVYADTPVGNDGARAFYLANGYSEAYRMPRYYSDDLDGVTFTKFFD